MSLLLSSGSTLRLFPPDDAEDVPRYSVQRSSPSAPERFITMIAEDRLSFEEDDDGKTEVRIGGNLVGLLDSSVKETLTPTAKPYIAPNAPKGNKDKIKRKPVKGREGESEESAIQPAPVSKIQDDANRFLDEWNSCLETVMSKDSGSVSRERSVMTPSLRKHLVEHEADFLEDRNITFRFLSWNLRGDPIYTTNEDITELFFSDGTGSDIYFVAFQEVIPLNAKNFRSSQVAVDNWTTRILSILNNDKEEYTVLQTNKLLGLTSILLCRCSLAINFHDIEISTVGTGILNIYGNKGAISTSFKIHDYNFSMLDCHFAAGESEHFVVKRRRELQGIKNFIKLPHANGNLVNEDKSILFEIDEVGNALKAIEAESDEDDVDENEMLADISPSETRDDDLSLKSTTAKGEEEKDIDRDKNIIFIGGDMNYRVKAPRDLLNDLINSKDYQTLVGYDSLTIEKDRGHIFQEYHEGNIAFPPTYKLDVLARDYEYNRSPSYTDRILHSGSKYVKIKSYKSPDIILSDHKPVFTDYELKLPIINNENRQNIVTTFLKKLDDHENNSKRTTLQIDPLEPQVSTRILKPTKLYFRITNTGNCKAYWEIMDSVDNINSRVPVQSIQTKLEPRKGVLPKSATQTILMTTTLPIGCRKLTKTIVLRAHNCQDYFISAAVEALPSYFGSTIDELHHGHNSGIPKPIYTLVNYLTHHITKDMFDESKLSFTHDLEKRVVQWIDEDKDLDTQELANADDVLSGSSSTAVARVLLLLLRNLDGGIVSEDLATYLLARLKGDSGIMEKILENLPPLRANVLIYLASFLRLCVEYGIPKDDIVKKFQPLFVEVPQRRKRDVVLGRTNYEKLRKEFMEKLLG